MITFKQFIEVQDRLSEAQKTNYVLRHELLAKKDDISKRLKKVMGKQPVCWVFGKGPQFRELEFTITWYLPVRQTQEDDEFFNHMAKIAAVAEMQKTAPEMELTKTLISPRARRDIDPKTHFVFTRKTRR